MTNPTERTKVKRIPKRGAYDIETIYAILDEAYICHVGHVIDGQPFVLPTAYARNDDKLIIHGSAASRMLRSLTDSVPLCITVTLTDGLVLARSAFHHSMNYRSVVILGEATIVEDRDEKMEAMRVLVEHLIPGRWEDCRQPNEKELKATTILEVPIDEASAKIRVGPASDDDEDYALSHWAGVIPTPVVNGTPEPDAQLAPGTPLPDYIAQYKRPVK
jgi:nitroimidazol reductase NimA-like FMN-containing flavoprotein (pyridoxamine 5'-phosphate oxidase superfamily)